MRGVISATINLAPEHIGGARTGSVASRTTNNGFASRWDYGTSATRSLKSDSLDSRTATGHQTGWTGCIAALQDFFGRITAEYILKAEKGYLAEHLVQEQAYGKALGKTAKVTTTVSSGKGLVMGVQRAQLDSAGSSKK